MKILKFIKRFMLGLFDNCALLYELIRAILLSKNIYGMPYFYGLKRGIYLIKKRRFRPNEAHTYGLFNPNLKNSELDNYYSKRVFSEIEALINPMQWFDVTEEKSVFYRYCIELGIDIPITYALIFKSSSGWTVDGEFLSSKTEWASYFEKMLPEEFVIKPGRVAYGHGFKLINRAEDKFKIHNGSNYTATQLYEELFKDGNYSSYIIQERLKSHRSIELLSGSQNLQTVRVVTFANSENIIKIIFSFIKLIVGDNILDNYDSGSTGNLLCMIDIKSGKIIKVVGPNANNLPGFNVLENHPVTNNPIIGFEIPKWREVCQCVSDAAKHFLPIRTLGWDIALTEDKPVIIEANIRWDPVGPNAFGEMREVVDILQEKRLYE